MKLPKISYIEKRKKENQIIQELLDTLLTLDPTDKEYAQVFELYQAALKLKTGDKTDRVKYFELISNTANLGMILNFEKLNVITSKAFGIWSRK